MTAPTLITLQSVPDAERGLLCVAQMPDHLPFSVKRFFTMNHVHKGMTRGDHAHKMQSQFFNCLSGAFEIVVEGRTGKTTYRLDRPDIALNVPPLHWVTIISLEDNGVMMVCASDVYDKADYICDRAAFKAAIQAG